MSKPHATVPVLVWADVDVGIAAAVEALNALPGVRTHASCQGSVGEGGAEPYRAYVMVSWESPAVRETIGRLYDLEVCGPAWGYARPRQLTAVNLHYVE